MKKKLLRFGGFINSLRDLLFFFSSFLLDVLFGLSGFFAVLTGVAHNKLILLYTRA